MADDTETLWEGRFLAIHKRGRWEYAARTRSIEAAVILAIDAGHVLLVEQFRVPLGARCLELPAGLVGDDEPDEAVELAAGRELEEECGYRADKLEAVGRFASSPGMTSETFTLVKASALTKVSEGGGVEGEDITVHRVALSDLPGFIAARRAEGVMLDARMLALLGPSLLS